MSSPAKATAALRAYIEAFNAGDAEALAGLFADTAVIEDPVGTPLKSADEIPEWFRKGVAMGARLELVAPIRSSHGCSAAMAFKVHMIDNGLPLTIHSLDTVDVDEHGRITRLNGYWGAVDVEAGSAR